MAKVSDFEVRANNIKTAIEAAKYRVINFGYSTDSEDEAVSRVVGMFITWLTACEESRQLQSNKGASFTRNVIEALPDKDDPRWDVYITPPPKSTLRQRVEALWGIRIAYTHCDGDLDLISNQINRRYAADAATILNGVEIHNGKLILRENVYHEAIRTMVQVRDVLQCC